MCKARFNRNTDTNMEYIIKQQDAMDAACNIGDDNIDDDIYPHLLLFLNSSVTDRGLFFSNVPII